MKERLIVCILILCLFPMSTCAVEIPSDLQIITENNAPFNYQENGTLKGMTVDLMEAILHDMGSNLTHDSFRLMPWDEAFSLIKSTPDTVILAMDRLPEREGQFLWAGPVVSVPQVLYHRSDRNIKEKDLGDLRIVTITDDCGRSYAIHAGADEDHLVNVSLIQDAVQMVENGSADGFVYNVITGTRAIKEYSKDPSSIRVGPELGSSTVYFAFNNQTPTAFVDAVNTTLQTFKVDRTNGGVTEYEQIIAKYLPVQCAFHETSKDRVVDLVNLTATAIGSDAPGTFADINAGIAPYRDTEDPELYVFVFDTGVNLIANAMSTANVGKNLSGTFDVAGKPFRDLMVQDAIRNNTGWISYTYTNAHSLGLYQKMSYYQSVGGSDGKTYVVGAGRYASCNDGE